MNLAIRDMRHNLGRFVLTCFGLSLLLGVVISMIGIYRGMVEDAINLIEQPRVDLWIVEGGTRGPFAEASHLPGDIREAVARLNGVEAAGALTYQSVETLYKERKVRIYVVGYEPGRIGGPGSIIDGRDITRPHFEMVADVKTGFALGEPVTLGRDTYTVVGLIRDQVSASGDPVVYIPLKDSQTLQFDLLPSAVRREAHREARAIDTPDTVNVVVARLARTQSPEQVAEAIIRWKHLAVMSSAQQQEIMIGSVVEQSRKQIGMFTILLLVVSAVILALIIHTLTMDKRREIATLKLIGAPDRVIIGLILEQSLAMGVISYGLGAVLISLTAEYFPRRVILFGGDVALLSLVILGVCIAASGTGVRMALKIDAGSALGG
ncbi:MAG: ABC transporter permease [Deltaproteobacteria bacterium]|nr:ABC transporter permease [Deltaproteobacteria bacterium]